MGTLERMGSQPALEAARARLPGRTRRRRRPGVATVALIAGWASLHPAAGSINAACAGGARAGSSAGLAFTEEALARGVDHAVGEFALFGRGLAFADLDADGDPDLVLLGRADGRIGVFENDGTGHFADRSAAAAPIYLHQSSLIAGDYDGDGDPDLYLGREGERNVLLRNDGDFAFTDVTAAAGVGDGISSRTYGGGWGDFDLDGDLDLYVSNRAPIGQPQPNRLYRNDGDGTFTDVGAALGVDRAADPTFQSSFLDYDLDGDADLYVANDKGGGCSVFRNYLFENVGGSFVDVTETTGTEACVLSMCIAIGDFDGNAWPDLFVTNGPSGHALMLADGRGAFDRAEVAAGVAGYESGWGAVFCDFDLDGHLDLYVTNEWAPNQLFRHDGAWPCAETAASAGLADPGRSFAVAVADIDEDGDLDLALSNSDDRVRLFVNQAQGFGAWTKLRVAGPGAHRDAVGARLEVSAGGRTHLREVVAGSNYLAQNELAQHVGLGTATSIDAVVVVWPGGATRLLTNLPIDASWTVYPSSRLGDVDGDGLRDATDLAAMVACAGPLAAGCEIFDFTGDATIDAADAEEFTLVYDGVVRDCDDDGTLDLVEIVAGSAEDADGDGLPDACEHAYGDVNDDLVVDIQDLLALLSAWAQPGGPADLDGDGIVGIGDLLVVLSGWG